jgi:hypothetical protein
MVSELALRKKVPEDANTMLVKGNRLEQANIRIDQGAHSTEIHESWRYRPQDRSNSSTGSEWLAGCDRCQMLISVSVSHVTLCAGTVRQALPHDINCR